MIELLKEYASKRADLFKIEATEKAVTILGAVAIAVLIAIFSILFIIIFFIGIGFLIGHYLHNDGFGLLIVSAVFLLLIFVIGLSRKSIKNFIANNIIKLLEE